MKIIKQPGEFAGLFSFSQAWDKSQLIRAIILAIERMIAYVGSARLRRSCDKSSAC